jgi:hypothetical protein
MTNDPKNECTASAIWGLCEIFGKKVGMMEIGSESYGLSDNFETPNNLIRLTRKHDLFFLAMFSYLPLHTRTKHSEIRLNVSPRGLNPPIG